MKFKSYGISFGLSANCFPNKTGDANGNNFCMTTFSMYLYIIFPNYYIVDQ